MTHSPEGAQGGEEGENHHQGGGPPPKVPQPFEVGMGTNGDGTRTVGLVAIQGLDGEQQVLVLQVFDLREDGFQLGDKRRRGGQAV